MNKTESSGIIILSDDASATLQVVGDIGSVLSASCIWKPAVSAGSETGNISVIRLPDQRIRFGLGAAAFGPSSELAIQQLGECALIEGIPWWTPAEKSSTSRREDRESEMLTPFLFAWDTLDSAWAFLNSSSDLSLIEWYEHILEHPTIGKTGAIAIEVVAQMPAGFIVDKYMCRAPLAQFNTLPKGRMITDPDLIDVYFLRNTVRSSVPLDTVCTIVMVGVVADPAVVGATWGDDVLQRGFYTTPGISSHAKVIQHTHAVVVLGPWQTHDSYHKALQFNDNEIDAIVQDLESLTQKVYTVHVENDTRLSQAIARIGIIENIEIKT